MRTLCSVAALLVCGIHATAQEPWPQANGPYGNFAPLKSGTKLLDDISKSTQVWLSEDDDLGYAKGSVSGYLSNLARWDGHPGSSSGPILADGKLFVSTFRPAEEPWAENQPGLEKILNPKAKKPLTDEEKERLKANLRILADDLLVAIDIETGETAWKVAEAGGLNRYMGKRQGFCVSPAYHKGTVFSLGTTGLLRAYNASNGDKLWERSIGKTRDAALEHKEKVLEKKVLPGGMGWDSSLTIAEGVLVVPLFDGTDLSLRGVNVENGDTIWEMEKACSKHATPSTWKHSGKEWVLTATVSGKLHLIDPSDGTVKWTVDGLGENHFSLSPSDGRVFVNKGTKLSRKKGGDDDFYAHICAYQITPDEATFAWEVVGHPALYYSTWMDNCARRFMAVADGKLYYYAIGSKEDKNRLLILDELTGRMVGEHEFESPAPQFYPVEDRLLMIRDASHSDTHMAFFRTDPKAFEPLSELWDPPHQQTSAYEVFMEHPYHKGRIYIRTKDGRIACYDLTKD